MEAGPGGMDVGEKTVVVKLVGGNVAEEVLDGVTGQVDADAARCLFSSPSIAIIEGR